MCVCLFPHLNITELILQVFLNEKYGVYWHPLTIDKTLMENSLLKKMADGDRSFLLKWSVYSDTVS